jgi:hypothetical protein
MRASKSKVQLYAAIRRDHRIEDLSIRLLAERYGVRRREVRKALQSVFPEPRKKMKPALAPGSLQACTDPRLRGHRGPADLWQ